MERKDLEIIEKYQGADEALAKLYTEHLEFEKQLEKINNKPFLTPTDEIEKKEIQKKKLLGKDMLEGILQKYRNLENN